eukprot:scaffold1785_cov32-Prasinocladus_malaysianus.AAC.1
MGFPTRTSTKTSNGSPLQSLAEPAAPFYSYDYSGRRSIQPPGGASSIAFGGYGGSIESSRNASASSPLHGRRSAQSSQLAGGQQPSPQKHGQAVECAADEDTHNAVDNHQREECRPGQGPPSGRRVRREPDHSIAEGYPSRVNDRFNSPSRGLQYQQRAMGVPYQQHYMGGKTIVQSP